ncbi:MAG: DNA polymerase III subunit alpha [Bacilli bacterium]|nr:DNA polymerase III subunit alpha [Bacilli bacterium]
MEFVPLYVRSEYSMLQSTCSIEKLVSYAKEYGYQSLAVTDEGVMHGTIKFYNACKKAGIKPVIGLKVPYNLNGVISNILLYAMDISGYRNLMRISSRYKTSNSPIDLEDLRKCSLGVLAVTPGNDSIIYNYLRSNNQIKIKEHLSLLNSVFNNLYVGISLSTIHDRNNLDNYYQNLNNIGAKMVAIQPVYYLTPDDLDAYIVLRSISNNGNLVNITESEANSYLYLSSEIEYLFNKYPELINNSKVISDKCDVEIEFGKFQLPKYSDEIDADKYLYELSILGLKKRLKQLPNVNTNIYIERLKKEYETIVKMGFADYFLIVWDYVKYAKKNNIYVGPGRGSAGASLIAYCLGITDVDPIKYNLLFERFLNEERVTMPDIDIDFPDDERDKVIQYVGKRYGASRVAHIGTFGTFQVKLAINDTARVYKTKDTHLKQILKILNAELENYKIHQPSLYDIIEKSDQLKQLMDEYEEINKVLNVACKLQGLPRNVSTHAAGIIITKYPLVNYTALDNGLEGIYQTQFEASDLESLGLLKMDFLGLKNLTNISKTIELIKLDNPEFSLPKDENDQEVFKMLASGDVVGVFQLESAGMSKVIKELNTSSLDDIISALALYRPGPMDIIPTFIKRKFGKESVTYPHEDLHLILKDTYGTIVYQEQIMQIAVKFAGYSLGRADILRRAVSKKKKEVLEQERISFVNSSINKGYDRSVAEEIYDYIVKFADYGFNKAHSVAYAKLSYQTAYLKCHYPTYYMSTLMSTFIGSNNDIVSYYKEALRKNIGVMGPNINESLNYFASVDNKILFPLTIIKGLGEVKAKEIMEERLKGKFESFKDFLIRTKDIIPFSLINNIIYSGALDSFKLTKKAMIESAKLHIDLVDYEDIPGMKGVTYTDEEYPYGILLEKEKEVLGLNIKYNFFKQYAHIYQTKHLAYIKDAKENMQIRTLGILSKIREIKTKKDELMAFALIEDNMNEIELTIFPRVYNRYPNLTIGSIVIITGVVTKRNNLQIVVDDIQII